MSSEERAPEPQQQQPPSPAAMDAQRKLVPAAAATPPPSSRGSAGAAANSARASHKYNNAVKNASGGRGAQPQSSGRSHARHNNTTTGAAASCDHTSQAKQVTTAGAANAAPRPVNAKKQLRYDKYDDYSNNDNNSSGGAEPTANTRGSTKYIRQQRPTRQRQSSYNAPLFTKEQYLQSNCQFVVNAGGDYRQNLIDPDAPVDWDQIEELRMSSHEQQSCPICLYPPIAAKMTRCGHVYCWPCVLHYLSLSDKPWRKCPICYDAVYAQQLKSFQSVPLPAVAVAGELSLRLMCRQRGSVLIAPAFDEPQSGQQQHDGHAKYDPSADVVGFAKLQLASAEDIVRGVLAREREQLQLKYWEDEGLPEACFITQAFNELDKREEALLQGAQQVEQKARSSSPPPPPPATAAAAAPICYVDAFEQTVLQPPAAAAAEEPQPVSGNQQPDDETQATLADAARVSRQSDGRNSSSNGSGGTTATHHQQQQPQQHVYYFYQCADGQQVYLHPLNARCVIDEYGSLAAAPRRLAGCVLQLEHLVMTHSVRHKFRYLSHLPLGTCFTLAELRLPAGTLSPAVQRAHAHEFARRQAARVKREQSETRRQVRAEHLDRQLLMDPANYPKYYARKEQLQPEDFPDIRFVGSAQHELQAEWTNDASPPSQLSPEQQQQPQGVWGQQPTGPAQQQDATPPVALVPSVPSFAQMLRQGKPKAGQPAPTGGAAASTQAAASTGEDEERAAPRLSDAWGAAVDTAFSALGSAAAGGEAATSSEAAAKPTKKGKKKPKHIVLFST